MSEERLSSALIAISNGVGVNKFGDPRDIADKVVAKFKSERDRADKAEAQLKIEASELGIEMSVRMQAEDEAIVAGRCARAAEAKLRDGHSLMVQGWSKARKAEARIAELESKLESLYAYTLSNDRAAEELTS